MMYEWYTIFCGAFFAVFTGVHAALMAGLFLEARRDRRTLRRRGTADSPGGGSVLVSVVVPFRNEQRRMGALLAALSAQDYPEREFIFINDRSGDGTGKMLEAFAKKEARVSIITLKENPGPNHKQFALGQGIQAARGELILFTDGDCEFGPGWIRAMKTRMEDSRTGAAIGPVFKKPGGPGFFFLYQCFDHAVRYLYLAASTGLGAAGGGFGNNLIVKRETLDAIGGYESVPPSPTEDAALVSRIREVTGRGIRSICGTDAAVTTAPEPGWQAFVDQTLRWNNGGLFSPDITTRCSFTFLVITISMGMLALPVVPFLPRLWPLPAAVLLSMSANTIATLLLFGAFLPKAGAAYIIQTIFTPLYFTFLTILGLLGFKPAWKSSDT
ncbi:MAG: glycosyltransferase [Treponema sp.]|jgi:cellulose synthase/poly-beta-1,6-N-acetylglucosamine synthase-like glycosyltransferase|nr:glycosyltransferase [Treponema sp.]